MPRYDEFYVPQREGRTRRPAAVAEQDKDLDRELDDRMLDLDADDESAFLRGQRRIPVRRGALPKKAANRLKQISLGLLVLGTLGAAVTAAYAYGTGSWRFRVDSSDNIEVTGTHSVSHAQVMEVVGGDIGRNVFFIPLAERKKQLEEIPWVESAAVMRLLPNRLNIEVRERTPVAFARVGSKVVLVDAHGVILDIPPHSSAKYSFPVITTMEETDPLSTRAARMKIYGALVSALDADGAHYSSSISEVDLSDPEDVKITVADSAGAVLIHLGDQQFLERYKLYLAHIEQWRQQNGKVESVDLRYDRQVIVNPDSASSQEHTGATTNAQPHSQPTHRTVAAPHWARNLNNRRRH